MGLLRQIPREDWRGADGVPEVHGLGSSRSIPWVRLSCRVFSSLADNTNRLILLLTRFLIILRDNWLAGLYPESHGIVGNQFYDREVVICNVLDDDEPLSQWWWWPLSPWWWWPLSQWWSGTRADELERPVQLLRFLQHRGRANNKQPKMVAKGAQFSWDSNRGVLAINSYLHSVSRSFGRHFVLKTAWERR